MSRCPLPSVQKRLLPNINTVLPSDSWLYGISKQWLTQWKLLLQDKSSEDKKTLGQLTVEQKVENNDFISEKWWKILVSWHGLDRNAVLMRQPISSTYIQLWDGNLQNSVFIDKEKDFLTISVCLFGDIENEAKHKTLIVSALDTFDFIEYQIRRLFDLPSKCKNRLWINIQENENDILFDALDDLSALIIAKAALHLPWLPKLLSDMDQSRSARNKDLFLFSERNVKVIISAESYISANQPSEQGWVQHSVEGEYESIVTLTTVSNKWEELFTKYLDEFTNEVSDITRDKRGILINAAKEIVSEKVSETEKVKSKMEEKLNCLEEREKKINEKEIIINIQEEEYKKKLVKYKEGLASFMKEKNRLEMEWKNAKEQNMIKDSQVTLNIGGDRFTTSLTTLTNVENTLFVQLFCGTYTAKPSEDGSYFFDRDGTHFCYILNYLRNGPKTVTTIPNQQNTLQELLNEARYYQMSEFESLILERIEMSSVEGDMGYISYPSLTSSFSSMSSK